MLKKINFSKKLFIYCSILTISIVLIINAFAYIYVSILLKQRETANMQQLISGLSSQLDNTVKELEYVTAQVVFNRSIQNVMYSALLYDHPGVNYFDQNRTARAVAQDALMSINSPKDISKRISILNNHSNFISVGTVSENPAAIQKAMADNDWFADTISLDGEYIVRPPHNDEWGSENEPVISVARAIKATLATTGEGSASVQPYQSGQILGIVEAQQSYSAIEEICLSGKDKNIDIIVFDGNGKGIYPQDLNSEKIDLYQNILENLKKSGDNIVENPSTKKQELVSYISSDYTGWTVMTIQSKTDFMQPIYTFQKLLAVFGGLTILITLFVVSAITKSVTGPLRELRKSLAKVSLDNYSITLNECQSNDEIIQLNRAFNDALERLKDSSDQVIQARISESHAHLLALQAQMSPHFLYNTLMCISSVGVEIKNRKIVSMCTQFSEMLRYTADYHKTTVTLRDEIYHAENYLNLIKARYQDLLEFQIDIEEELYDITVPKLILQPIIENCINHGFKNSEPPWRISVTGIQEQKFWKLSVLDNGSGFEKSFIDTLKDKLEYYRINIVGGDVPIQLELNGLGIINIYIRLKFLYHENAIFDIRNNTTGGALVTIGGPCLQQEGVKTKC